MDSDLRLRWTRTGLVVIGFVWVMLAWHYHENTISNERAAIIAMIVRSCAADYPDSQSQRDQCEILFRSRLVGGINVGGSVDVAGTIDVAR